MGPARTSGRAGEVTGTTLPESHPPGERPRGGRSTPWGLRGSLPIFSGYENFVSKIHTEQHEDRPDWMGKVDFSGLKLKLIASIVAISGIELLKAFVNIGAYTDTELAWKVGIHAVLVVSGVLLAWMDRIAAGAQH